MIGLAFGIVTAAIAYRKGLNPFLWVMTFGIIGLITIACVPAVEPGICPEEEAARNLKRGNTWGAVLTSLAILLTLGSTYAREYEEHRFYQSIEKRHPQFVRPQMDPKVLLPLIGIDPKRPQ